MAGECSWRVFGALEREIGILSISVRFHPFVKSRKSESPSSNMEIPGCCVRAMRPSQTQGGKNLPIMDRKLDLFPVK